ncbi:uncharacterized protein LOC100895482 isoform X8 [Callithrix jacchus]
MSAELVAEELQLSEKHYPRWPALLHTLVLLLCLLETARSGSQANHCNLCLLDSIDSPASASQPSSWAIGVFHHTQLIYISTHSLRYDFIALSQPSPGQIPYEVSGYLDDQPFLWCCKEGRWAEPRTSWAQARDPRAWEKLVLRLKARAQHLVTILRSIMAHNNQSQEPPHTKHPPVWIFCGLLASAVVAVGAASAFLWKKWRKSRTAGMQRDVYIPMSNRQTSDVKISGFLDLVEKSPLGPTEFFQLVSQPNGTPSPSDGKEGWADSSKSAPFNSPHPAMPASTPGGERCTSSGSPGSAL